VRVLTYAAAFLASGAVVAAAGVLLVRCADAIADATGIGRLWIGTVLLAAATSLPELATDVSAVRLGAPDLGVGDLLGSSLANMLILAVVDLLPPRGRVLRQAALDHALAASLAIALTASCAALVLSRSETSLLWVSPGSVALTLLWLAGVRVVYLQAGPRAAERSRARPEARRALPRSLRGFLAAAATVLVSAPIFAWSAQGLADESGLGQTFVGTVCLGLATSLPEFVTSLAAVRIGAYDLAVGNLFGSNAFNMAILLALDAAQPGSLYTAVDPAHAISAMFAIALMSVGLAAIAFRAERRYALLEPDSLLIAVGYVAAIGLLYAHASR
jgi:cation:H+ antiporter